MYRYQEIHFIWYTLVSTWYTLYIYLLLIINEYFILGSMAEVESEQEKTNAISGSMATLIEEKQQAPVSFFLYAWVAWYTREGGDGVVACFMVIISLKV